MRCLTSAAVDAIAQRFPRFEVWEATGGHRHLLTRFRVTDLPCLVGTGTETAEPTDLDATADIRVSVICSSRVLRTSSTMESSRSGFFSKMRWMRWDRFMLPSVRCKSGEWDHGPVNHSNLQQVATQAEHGRFRPQSPYLGQKRGSYPLRSKPAHRPNNFIFSVIYTRNRAFFEGLNQYVPQH